MAAGFYVGAEFHEEQGVFEEASKKAGFSLVS